MTTNSSGRPWPPGTTSQVRDQPDVRCASDIPVDVPVYVYYERHMGGEPKGLIGWTARVEAFLYGVKVRVKMGRSSKKLEVWIDIPGKPSEKVYSFKVDEFGQGRPPFSAPSDGSMAALHRFMDGQQIGKHYEPGFGVVDTTPAEKAASKPKPPDGPHCSQCLKPDEGDLVDHSGKQYCMICYIKAAR